MSDRPPEYQTLAQMILHNLPTTPAAFIPALAMLAIFMSARLSPFDEESVFLIAFGWAIALRVGFNIPWLVRRSHSGHSLIALGFWLVVPLLFLATGSALLCLRLFHLHTGMMLLLVFSGMLLEDRRYIGELFSFASRLNSRDWLNRVLLHWACIWICLLEGLIFLSRDDLSALALLVAFCLLAMPASLRLICAYAVRRESVQRKRV